MTRRGRAVSAEPAHEPPAHATPLLGGKRKRLHAASACMLPVRTHGDEDPPTCLEHVGVGASIQTNARNMGLPPPPLPPTFLSALPIEGQRAPRLKLGAGCRLPECSTPNQRPNPCDRGKHEQELPGGSVVQAPASSGLNAVQLNRLVQGIGAPVQQGGGARLDG